LAIAGGDTYICVAQLSMGVCSASGPRTCSVAVTNLETIPVQVNLKIHAAY
jgi:hypothetical protein